MEITDLCDGCKSNDHVCLIKHDGIDPKDCPCFSCLVKSMCDVCCDDYYGLKFMREIKPGVI